MKSIQCSYLPFLSCCNDMALVIHSRLVVWRSWWLTAETSSPKEWTK